MDFAAKIQQYHAEGIMSSEFKDIIASFIENYILIFKKREDDISLAFPILEKFLDLCIEQCRELYRFEAYHHRITEPFDYYRFGIDFMRPCIDFSSSQIANIQNVERIVGQLHNNENVILFGNHQTEAEPQVINILLEKTHPEFVAEVIFVAGERVLTDPTAAPFSMGCNLLCIYSKRYLNHPPELRTQKQRHNQKAISVMRKLLNEGGKCIYVAPSGGRDRPDKDGNFEPAPFDPQSLELFFLIASRSQKITHFYPLALSTYKILPPPATINRKIGEKRLINYAGVSMSFGDEMDLKNFPGSENLNRQELRTSRAEYAWQQVRNYYKALP